MPTRRRLTPSRLSASCACLAAGLSLAACGGSSGSGSSHPTASPAVQGPARDGLLQVQILANNNLTNQVAIETSDGVVVKTVTLPPNASGGQVVGPGKAVYSTNPPFALVNGDGTTKTITAPSSDYRIDRSKALGPYPARYLPVQDIGLHTFLLDTVNGTTADLASVGAGELVTAIFNSADGHAVLVENALSATVVQPSKPSTAHHFPDGALPGGFTADGQAIVAEPTDKSHARVVSFNVDTGKENEIATVATRQAIAVPVGNTVVVGTGNSLELFSPSGGNPRTISTGGAEVQRITPAGDGRHALVYTGLGEEATVSLLDVSTGGGLTKLPLLTGTVPHLTNGPQRYLLFAANNDQVLPTGKAYGVDTYTGQVTTLNLPQVAGSSSSIDGKVRTIETVSGALVTDVFDLSTGSMTTVQGTASVSPSGNQLVVRNGTNPLQVTDLKGKRTATLQSGFAVWTPA